MKRVTRRQSLIVFMITFSALALLLSQVIKLSK
jgi:hypothetical protein